MRSLAIARYRLLRAIRSSTWTFGVSIALALGPIAALDSIFTERMEFWFESVYRMRNAAFACLWLYAMHTVLLGVACEVFGTQPRIEPAVEKPSDLIDTAPVTPQQRFLGDALGILATVLVIHIATLPLLAFAVAVSPLPSIVFFAFESALLGMMIIASAAASWKLRTSMSRWGRSASLRSALIFVLLLLGIVGYTTRWHALRDALTYLLPDPSPVRWRHVVEAIVNPVALVSLVVLLYASFIAFYFYDSVRSLERR